MLELRIIGVAQRPAQRKTDPEGTGRPDGHGVFFDQADLGGGDSFFFKIMGQPADGARAVRSDRHQ
jgi:hypothetical protein